MLNWKPRNKFRPYISNSMNRNYIESNWTKEAFEKAMRKLIDNADKVFSKQYLKTY